MNFIKKIFIILVLIVILIYTVNITSIPKSIILFQSEELNIVKIFGIDFEEEQTKVIQTSSNSGKTESKTVTVKLFNTIPVKKINVSTIKNTKIVPLGNTIGIKLYSDGVLVIGMTEVEGKKPYENTGIKEGDLIVSVDNVLVTTTEKLIECVNNSEGEKIELEYMRDGTKYLTKIEPVRTKENDYKIGLWVRDGAVGIGTATYYEPTTKKIATLGHGIVDRDTDKLISVEKGEILTSQITKIKKGEKGTPGEIKGVINENKVIGTINQNTIFGIYGFLKDVSELKINESNAIEVALKDEIKIGKANVILTIDGKTRKEYEIEIKKIYKNNTEDNKSMLIEIVDEELISKTGGIVQGMSGAPIIQNGKFIGAVTHVLVNNPLQGYAVFGETMIKQMNT